MLLMKHQQNLRLNAKRLNKWLRLREVIPFSRFAVHVFNLSPLWNKGFYLLAKRILLLARKSGKTFTRDYLKGCSAILLATVSGETPTQNKIWVSTTRSGIPRIIPKRLRDSIRLFIEFPDTHLEGYRVLRVVLTILNVWRLFNLPLERKVNTITDSFSGKSKSLPKFEIVQALDRLGVSRFNLASPELLVSESAGPNYRKATWSSPLDAIAFIGEPRTYISALRIGIRSHSLWVISWLTLLAFLGWPLYLWRKLRKRPLVLGKLNEVLPGGGKVRVVACTDYWTQVILKPLHDCIFDVLAHIPMDGTFDQTKPLLKLIESNQVKHELRSFDLSAATDRLPIDLQVDILSNLITWSDS